MPAESDFRALERANRRETVMLIGAFILLFVAIGCGIDFIAGTLQIHQGHIYGAPVFMGLALIFASVQSTLSYFGGAPLILLSVHAQPLMPDSSKHQMVLDVIQEMAVASRLPVPKAYFIPDPSPNAFATGRNPSHASVAFTEGILQLMNDNEIEGVVAHELGHVLHRDILISSIAAMLAAAITFLARMAFWFGGSRDEDDREGGVIGGILMMILAPLAAMLIQMAISRSREYDADAASAKYVGSPYPLINGLQKLEGWSKRIPMDATPSTAHMFIIQPFTGENLMRLFSTHPSTEDRIARLQAMR